MALAVLVSSCASPPRPIAPVTAPAVAMPEPPPRPASTPAIVRVQTPAGVVAIPLEQYVAGTVAGELAVGALPEAVADRVLALQAIVARTWALANLGRHRRDGFDFCATTHCQVMRAPEAILAANRAPVARATAVTEGRVLAFAGRPIDAVFHADCGGATSPATTVWGGEGRPYLQPVRDDACLRDPGSAWTYRAARDQLREALNTRPATAVGARLDRISPVDVDDSLRVALVALDGERSPIVRGEELRAAVTSRFGPRTFRSPRFTVTREGDVFVFAGRGFGHGVGLCQRGAIRRLVAGDSVEAVLATYYRGANVTGSPARLSTHLPGLPLPGLP